MCSRYNLRLTKNVVVMICTYLCEFVVCMYVAALLLKLIANVLQIRRRPYILLVKTYEGIHRYLLGNTIERYKAAIGSFYSVTYRLICRRKP